jgi:TolB-like protein/Tfp pilus assembly protein PilF
MAADPKRISRIWLKLKRSKVIRVITVYAASAFVILQLVSIIEDPLQLPEWMLTLVIVLLCVGFAVAVIIAWIFDIPLEGIKKTEPIGIINASESSICHSEYENSIAVLPFHDMSPEKTHEYFCDGMAEEIINVLSQVDGLKVIARTSAFVFKERHEDMREIGKKLGVSHLLEGSLRKSDNRLRITAQLINAEDGSHLWSENFNCELGDVFVIQDEIAVAIVERMKTKLPVFGMSAQKKHNNKSTGLYNLYLLGRYHTNKRNTESLKKAIEHYKEAIAEDPGYALAYAGLSEAYALSVIGYSSSPPKEGYQKAKETALKSIELNNELAEAHASLAFVKQYFEFDWPVVEGEWRKAIELNPGYAPAHQWYGEYLLIMKRWEESYIEFQLALELDPLSFIIHTMLGWLFHYQHKLDKAIEQYKKVIAMAPDYAVVYFNLGIAYSIKNMHDEAIEVSKKAVALSGDSPFMKAGLAYVFAHSGQTELALKIKDEMNSQIKSGIPLHGPLATVYVGLNKKEEAIKCLEMASRNKTNLSFLARAWYEDYLNSNLLSDDPRFIDLQKIIGLEK